MKSLFISLLALASFTAKAQDTTKVEQYCELQAQGRLFSNKITIDVNFGEERKFFAGDTRLRDEMTGKLKKFNSLTDALNYMGAQGWSLVNAFPIASSGGPQIYFFYFKKLYNKSDIDRTN
jgi:hypothetical protein